ncbi:spore coat -like domain protein [Anoxybacillus sp. B7M1]|uniref:Spore coat protein n=1 Tax=Anoxybacteroides rupiense TaxID=311460 RepID=A0ABD5ITY6_9BACL|nr:MULTISPECIES: spore coat protein [Anoxybacillus]ANB57850.1 spore coat -like domain protein [Anoxybacillus sp. B2M1]ANB65418.1 spore coat -like domain protein [Anoxybacillus sp. B7M1]KXG10762.1 hypothetical protein AT864_01353 [Anoxybacillus sp. P3H1B]MBB3905946.1 hypothetical protein [Anoxybacillus rupiensis]MBS2772195.1 spore coat protein [Anoxybacillus rupiensis]
MRATGVHEILELHELLMLKNVCLAKSKVMQTMATDPELQSLIRQDIETTQQQIVDLQSLLS